MSVAIGPPFRNTSNVVDMSSLGMNRQLTNIPFDCAGKATTLLSGFCGTDAATLICMPANKLTIRSNRFLILLIFIYIFSTYLQNLPPFSFDGRSSHEIVRQIYKLIHSQKWQIRTKSDKFVPQTIYRAVMDAY